MKILATGSKGMLGGYLPFAWNENEVISTDIGEIDVRNREEVETAVQELQPDFLFHLAALTDVDYCEREPDEAYKTNVIGTLNAALSCQKFDIPMVYISTVGVFGGIDKADEFTEFDRPAPVSVYGKTKLEGENIVRELLNKFFVVRAGWMMGGGPERDHKFVGKMVELFDQRDSVKVVHDKYGTPTYAKQFVKNLRVLVESGYYGLYHCVNTGVCNRYEMALEIADFLDSDVEIIPVNSAHFPLPAPRPRSEAGKNYKLELLGLNRMSHWKEAV
ncbi:MAG: dTDP-4-dehydrorhamnose reductase, partial [Anaerolineales bacterium]